MKASRFAFCLITLFASLSLLSFAQEPGSDSTQSPQQRSPGQRGRGQWGVMMGAGVGGTVTEVASDHFTVKTESGESYTIYYSVNTRVMKGGGGGAARRGQSEDQPQFTPPQAIKPTEIKVGDVIIASGERDDKAKSVGAVVIFQVDPERARQMREMRANYGKTWLMGRVTAINEAKVTIEGGPDDATRTFVADENTTFRKRRDPITLADIQPGDMIRVEGAVKNGEFIATTVVAMGPPPQRPGTQNGTTTVPPQ